MEIFLRLGFNSYKILHLFLREEIISPINWFVSNTHFRYITDWLVPIGKEYIWAPYEICVNV